MQKLKFDLHVHTEYSDGIGSIREILLEAYRKGLNGIAITDHNTTIALKEVEKYSSKLGLMVIPGLELKTDAGHILALGVNVNLKDKTRLIYEDAIDWIRSLGGITIIAHPAIEVNKMNKWIIKKPDAIEAFNSNYPFNTFLIRGWKIINRIRVPITAGSDAHNPKCIGNAYTIIEVNELSIEEILKAIKLGRTKVFGKLSPIENRMRIVLGYLK
ncbi:MAG: CehA/McbA family metallohydrolase [Candidatus Methanomethylicia archaeon]